MNWVRQQIVRWSLMLALCAVAIAATDVVTPGFASEIKYVVNGTPITTLDIQRRAAFLKLQRRKGNVAKLAAEDMIDQALRAAEIRRLNIRVTDDQVAASYKRFAESNKMTTKQLDGIMSQSGVTPSHFKQYIRSQMGWGQALSSRGRSGGGRMTEQEMVRKMLEKGGRQAQGDGIYAAAGHFRRSAKGTRSYPGHAQAGSRGHARALQRLQFHARIRQGTFGRDRSRSRPGP